MVCVVFRWALTGQQGSGRLHAILPPRERSRGCWGLSWRAGAGAGGGTDVPSLRALFLLMHRLGILPATAPGRSTGVVLVQYWEGTGAEEGAEPTAALL